MVAATKPRSRRKAEPKQEIVETPIPSEEDSGWGDTVDGVAVVEVEPIASNLARNPGKSGVTLRINRLTLADGTYRFGCADCDFVGAQRGDVQGHRQRDHAPPRRPGRGVSTELMGLTFKEVVALAEAALTMEDTVTQLEESVTHWRDRALAAERRSNAIENTFNRLFDNK